METPKGVFISYCWTTAEHEEWVLELATRLRENGVNVRLDKWDLKEGQDVYSFMESMVNSEEIYKVLIICDKGYKEKAEIREGGVGTETQIITPEIYKDAGQEKFIPIIAERGDDGETYIPTYIKTRKYIDMSSEDTYEKGYETLLRNIYDRPQYRKPGLGAPPEWLFENEAVHYKTTSLIKQLEDAMQRVPNRVKGLSNNFVESFFECLDQFYIKEFDKSTPIDETILNQINKMLPLRNDYITYLEKMCNYYNELDVEILINFFERIHSYTQPYKGSVSYSDYQFDHYKFIVHELFIYTFSILLNYAQYKTAGEFLRSDFFIIKEVSLNELSHEKYCIFQQGIKSLEYRKKRLELNRISLVADLFVQRAEGKKYNKTILDADLLLFYLQFIYNEALNWYWFPSTYIFSTYRKIDILQRLASKRFFNRVQPLFGISSDQLKAKFFEFKNDYLRGYNNSLERIPSLRFHINPNDICTLP